MGTAQNVASVARAIADSERSFQTLEFLASTLGQEEYGIDIQKIKELRGYEVVTHIANAAEFKKLAQS